MRSTLSVSSSVAVEANCPLRHHILGAEEIVIMFGDAPHDYFELSLAPEALRELVTLGMKALDELDDQIRPTPEPAITAALTVLGASRV